MLRHLWTLVLLGLCALGCGLEIRLLPLNSPISITKMPADNSAPKESLTISNNSWTVSSYIYPENGPMRESKPDRSACEAWTKELEVFLQKMIATSGPATDLSGDKYGIIIYTETGILNIACHSGDRAGIKKLFDALKEMIK